MKRKPSYKIGKYGEVIFTCADGRKRIFTTVESREQKRLATPKLPKYYGEFRK